MGNYERYRSNDDKRQNKTGESHSTKFEKDESKDEKDSGEANSSIKKVKFEVRKSEDGTPEESLSSDLDDSSDGQSDDTYDGLVERPRSWLIDDHLNFLRYIPEKTEVIDHTDRLHKGDMIWAFYKDGLEEVGRGSDGYYFAKVADDVLPNQDVLEVLWPRPLGGGWDRSSDG